MASIPLPALNIQQPPNPLDQYAKALSVKSMIQGQQTQQLQQQALGQENQQRQMQLDDANGQKKALIDANGDFGKFQQNLNDPQYGVSVQGQLDMSNKIMAHQKASYELDDASLGNAQKKATGMAGHLEPLTQLPDFDAVKDALPKVVNAALADGTLTQTEMGAIQHIGSMDDLKQHVSGLQMIGDQIKQAQDNRKAGTEAWKELPGTGQMINVDRTDPANFGKTMGISNGLPIPADLAKSLGIPELAGTKTTPQMLKAYKEAADQGNHIENFGGNMNLIDSSGKTIKVLGQSPQIYLAQGAGMGVGGANTPGGAAAAAPGATASMKDVPGNLRDQVRQILDYRAPNPPQSRNNPVNQAMRQWIAKLDPTYDETAFPARNKILTSFTSGPESKSINAINTALGHLGELDDARQALNQNNVPLLHSLASRVGAAVGQDAPSTYQAILHRVAPEMTAAYVQGGGGEGERGANMADFDISKGASQIGANIAESAKLLRSKIGAQEQQWNTTFKPTKPADEFQNRFITPAAKATLDKLSSQAGGKTLSTAQIQQAAKDHGVSVDEATKQAKAAGYNVQ
jgi:hypothetical protein